MTAIAIMADSFPQSPALLAAKARKAAFLARGGDQAGALALFDEVVKESAEVRDSSAALRDLLAPYFALLAASDSRRRARGDVPRVASAPASRRGPDPGGPRPPIVGRQ